MRGRGSAPRRPCDEQDVVHVSGVVRDVRIHADMFIKRRKRDVRDNLRGEAPDGDPLLRLHARQPLARAPVLPERAEQRACRDEVFCGLEGDTLGTRLLRHTQDEVLIEKKIWINFVVKARQIEGADKTSAPALAEHLPRNGEALLAKRAVLRRPELKQPSASRWTSRRRLTSFRRFPHAASVSVASSAGPKRQSHRTSTVANSTEGVRWGLTVRLLSGTL